jgi:hypothetical protein
MAKSKQGGRSGSWKKERASVNSKKSPRPRSNKGSGADKGKRPAAGSTSQYWRAGYTRKDGTEVKGHYVKNPNQQ